MAYLEAFLRRNWRGWLSLALQATAFLTVVVLVAVIAGSLSVDNVRIETGFLLADDGKPLRWDESYVPISCTHDDSVRMKHLKLYYQAVNEYNSKVGVELFGPCSPWERSIDLPGLLFSKVLLRVAEPPVSRPSRHRMIVEANIPWIHPGGWTLLFARKKKPHNIVAAPVWMSPDHALSYVAWLHELGHVLGLEHTELRASVMWPKIEERSAVLSDIDISWLKEAYK